MKHQAHFFIGPAKAVQSEALKVLTAHAVTGHHLFMLVDEDVQTFNDLLASAESAKVVIKTSLEGILAAIKALGADDRAVVVGLDVDPHLGALKMAAADIRPHYTRFAVNPMDPFVDGNERAVLNHNQKTVSNELEAMVTGRAPF